jgi:hypothetical protein
MNDKPNSNVIDDATLAALGETAPPEIARAAVEEMVRKAIALEMRIDNGNDLLARLKDELKEIKDKKLPDALASLGTTSFVIDEGDMEGWGVEIKPFVGGILHEKGDEREAALDYIRNIGGENLIRNTVEAFFDKGQDNAAGEIKEQLKELGITFESKIGIHHMTLISFVKERMKNGEETDLDKIGLYAGRAAKMKKPKEKKVKATKAKK